MRAIQDELYDTPKYKSSEKKRQNRKYTEEMEERLHEILASERRKDSILGQGHKQKLTNKQIHQKLADEGFDISRATINIKLARIRDRKPEVFIRQQYDFGDRLEYDFGEVKLDCGDGVKVCHMAVLSSPSGKFRWAYLYTNQKKAVFMDSHVKFFEMMGGCYREVVYDNMRNVVKKFIGKNEKELNDELVKMSLYYGYIINVTNCFKGNEKGHVKKSVDVIRNEVFADTWKFNSVALKSIPRLKAIFDTHYAAKPRQFIEEFLENKHLPIDEIIEFFDKKTAVKGEFAAISVVKPISSVVTQTRAFIANYSVLINNYGGDRE